MCIHTHTHTHFLVVLSDALSKIFNPPLSEADLLFLFIFEYQIKTYFSLKLSLIIPFDSHPSAYPLCCHIAQLAPAFLTIGVMPLLLSCLLPPSSAAPRDVIHLFLTSTPLLEGEVPEICSSTADRLACCWSHLLSKHQPLSAGTDDGQWLTLITSYPTKHTVGHSHKNRDACFATWPLSVSINPVLWLCRLRSGVVTTAGSRWVWIKSGSFWSSDEAPCGDSFSSDSYHDCLEEKNEGIWKWFNYMDCNDLLCYWFYIFKESLKCLFLEWANTTTLISVKLMVSGEEPIPLGGMHLGVKWQPISNEVLRGEHWIWRSEQIALNTASIVHLGSPLSFMCQSSPGLGTGHSVSLHLP